MAICKMCGLEKGKLGRCHIYPASMTKEVAGPEQVMVSVSIIDGPRASNGIGGLRDRDIVCGDCERLFAPADDYAVSFRRAVLALKPPFRLKHNSVRLPTFEANAGLLHTFAMQTILRASLSSRWENAQIHAEGIHDEVIAALREGRSTIGMNNQVGIIVTPGDMGSYSAAPTFRDVPEHPLWVLALPNMIVHVSAGPKGHLPGTENLILRPGSEVTVWRRRRALDAELQEVAQILEPNIAALDRFERRSKSRTPTVQPERSARGKNENFE